MIPAGSHCPHSTLRVRRLVSIATANRTLKHNLCILAFALRCGRKLCRCASASRSIRQWIRAKLEVHDNGSRPFAPFLQPWRAVAACGPKTAPFPSGLGIIDAPIEALGVKAHGIGYPKHDHLALFHSDETVV